MGEPIGRHHPLVRRLRALRRDGQLRKAESVLVAEGIHLVREALRHRAVLECVVVSPKLQRHEDGKALLREVADHRAPCHEVADSVLESIQDARSPQPVLALVRRPVWPDAAGFTPDGTPSLLVAACGLQDPGNLGTLLRTADAAAAGTCFVCGDSADVFHPRAVRATMGSIFRLPVLRAEPRELLGRLRARGIAALGADPSGGTDYRDSDLTRPVALFFGSEAAGLPRELLKSLDERLHIPLRAGVDSLSVAAAAAVLLFEAARQRRDFGRKG